MTRTALFILMLLMSILVKAVDKSTECYVVIGDNTYYCNEIHIGQGNTRLYSASGIVKIPTPFIHAYAQNGEVFERLPVVNKNKDTVGWAFMQFISSRSGYRLYRYCSNCIKYDPISGEIDPSTLVYRYYIFKDGKFICLADETNVKPLLSRFGVKLRS